MYKVPTNLLPWIIGSGGLALTSYWIVNKLFVSHTIRTVQQDTKDNPEEEEEEENFRKIFDRINLLANEFTLRCIINEEYKYL